MLEIPLDEAEDVVFGLIEKNKKQFRDQFNSQRSAHNDELYSHDGGSPSSNSVWSDFQEKRKLKGAKGKSLFKQLKNAIPKQEFNESDIFSLIESSEETSVANDLHRALNKILKG